tara:strand:- start:2925 stop:3362 length:438 start_codon:yes stop_codon:yes gene_type:complete
MSWATCYSGSNNIHFESPPIMNDGRNYASWQPGAVINNEIKKKTGIKTNWQYRKYLIDNADGIIKYNQTEACNETGSCPENYTNNGKGPNTPYLYSSCTSKEQPYGYNNSDLKNLYLSEYQLQCRLVTPVLSQDQLIQQKYPNFN